MANGTDLLNELVTDPGDRAGVMRTVNTGLVNQYQAGEKTVQRLDETQKLLDGILQDTEELKAEFSRETAELVVSATTDMDQLLAERTQDFTRVSQTLASTTREMYELHQTATNPELPSKDRRAAAKEYNELNKEALRLDQMRRHSAERMQTLVTGRTQVAKSIQDSRSYQQRAQFDVAAFAEAARVEKLNKRLRTRYDDERANTALLTQMRTLGQSEEGTLDRSSMGMYKSAYMILNRGQNMDQFGDSAAKTTAMRLRGLSQAEQVAITPALAMIERAENSGEQLSWNDLRGMLVAEGRLDTLQVVAEQSGDTQLQNMLRDGRQSWVNNRRSKLVESYAAENDGKDPLPEQMEQIEAQVGQELQGLYARDIITAHQGNTALQVSAEVQAAGSDIYSGVADTMPINLEGLPANVRAVFDTDEFKSALAQPDLRYGDGQIGATAKMMEVFENSGVSEVDSAQAIAQLNRGAAMSWLRDHGSTVMEDIDTLSSIGRPTTSNLMRKQLPANTRRYAQQTDSDIQIKQYYDLSEATDILAMLEVLKASRSGRDIYNRRARRDVAGQRTTEIGSALQSFNRE